MKIRKLAIVCLSVMVLLSGCYGKKAVSTENNTNNQSTTNQTPAGNETNTNNENKTEDSISSELTVKDFIPENPMILVYDGDFENGGLVNIVDKIEGNKFQMKSINGGASLAHVYEVKGNEIKQVYREEIDDTKGNYIDKPSNIDEIYLKEPIKVGTKWTIGNSSYEITKIDEKVTTKAGTFDAIEITTASAGFNGKLYYSKGIGFIKSVNDMYPSELVKIIYDMKEADNPQNLFKLAK